jgi:hypothetical protein
MEGDNFINKITFSNTINQRISRELWDKLDKIRRFSKLKYETDPGDKCISFENFFLNWKSGSKLIRKILDRQEVNYVTHNMIKFAENTETIIPMELAKKLNKLWTNPILSTDTRTFIFKMHNNTLAMNTIVSHFVRGLSRNCTFCDIEGNPEIEDETILHLFFNCRQPELIINEIYKQITMDQDFTVLKREFFGEFKENNNFKNEMLLMVSILLRKHFWDCKTRKMIPTLRGAKYFLHTEMTTMSKISSNFERIFAGSGLNINILQG